MTNFEKFKKDFDDTYISIYDFMENYPIIGKKPLTFEEKK